MATLFALVTTVLTSFLPILNKHILRVSSQWTISRPTWDVAHGRPPHTRRFLLLGSRSVQRTMEWAPCSSTCPGTGRSSCRGRPTLRVHSHCSWSRWLCHRALQAECCSHYPVGTALFR